ncbi:MAG: hypothetical protein U0802_14070 [Candidatus Binatia bacterium]
MICFGLLHPSRGRPDLAAQAIAEWTAKRSGEHPVDHVLSIDADDDVVGYRRVAEATGVRLVVNPNRSIVDAANAAARASTGDLLIVVSDDFGCPDGWDRALAEVVGERRDVAVLVHDEIDGRILTLPIIGRALYEELGYVYHPAYFSMFVDEDLTCTAAAMGRLVDARHLVFPHRHYSVGRSALDATYARQNSHAAWWHGWRVIEKRRASNFGLDSRTLAVRLKELEIDLRYLVRTCGSRAKRVFVRRR